MRHSFHALFLPLVGVALLLAGCASTAREDVSAPTSAQHEQTLVPSATPDDVVAEYVECLHEHGLGNAAAQPDGSVSYEFTDEDLGDDDVITSSAGDTSAIEQACLQEAPGYTPPDENER